MLGLTYALQNNILLTDNTARNMTGVIISLNQQAKKNVKEEQEVNKKFFCIPQFTFPLFYFPHFFWFSPSLALRGSLCIQFNRVQRQKFSFDVHLHSTHHMFTIIISIYQHGQNILRIRNIITSTIQYPCLSLAKIKRKMTALLLLNSAKTVDIIRSN